MKMLINRKGQGLVEYALLVAVVAGIIILVTPQLRGVIQAAFTAAANAITTATTQP